MRSPEIRASHRAGRTFEEELSLRYLSPGAFTVLAPEDHGLPPEPPSAPLPYRLAPTNVRHKNQSFAILAESNRQADSRSPSPTSGRVSPFRGRGFNPTGSRHASPSASPPPPEELRYFSHEKINHPRGDVGLPPRNRSQIPQLTRRDSITESIGESSPKFRRKNGSRLSPQLSKSLTNVSPKNAGNRPPPSPRKYPGVYGKGSAFNRLSPIIGSSPEPSAPEPRYPSSVSSSKIPRSRSQPHSRRQSPNRALSPSDNNKRPHVSRNSSRQHLPGAVASSKNGSRNPSRDPSPGTSPTSPTRIPIRNPSYRNVQAKVNSFSPKGATSNSNSNSNSTNNLSSNSRNKTTGVGKSDERARNAEKNRVERKESYRNRNVGKNNNSTYSGNGKTFNRNSNNNNSSGAGSSKNSNSNKNTNDSKKEDSKTSNGNSNSNPSKNLEKKPSTSNISEKSTAKSKEDKSSNNNNDTKTESNNSSNSNESKNNSSSNNKSGGNSKSNETAKKVESVPRLTDMLPSAETMVSNTTTAVTKPLKIEAKIDTKPKETPMYMDETRVLSATSVSSAINRMNDTVLDSQTLMKDHNLTKLSPAATAIISLSNDPSDSSQSHNNGGNMNSAVAQVESVGKPTAVVAATTAGSNNGSVKTTGEQANDLKNMEHSVKNNIGKLISPDDRFGAKVSHMDVNERMKEARTMVAADVKPLQITVKERPSNADVQSGNVRLPANATNGIAGNERPGLPPPQPPLNHQAQAGGNPDNDTTPAKTNCCTKLFKCCGSKPTHPDEKHTGKASSVSSMGDGPPAKKNPFTACCRGGKKKGEVEELIVSGSAATATTSAVGAAAAAKKLGLLDRLNCCKRNKVGATTGCCSRGKRKNSWVDRRDSILSDLPPNGSCCKSFWRKVFCLNLACCCCAKKPVPIEDSLSRRTSLFSKKKSLTPTVLPPEEPKDKIDISLVEHTSTMKGAIPVLPVYLAWFCLVFNVIAPGTGTVFSGMFCLCMGKPRFSQKDGGKQRMGAFLIDIIIGCGQLFTVLFCLVGWGWSIWWGCIMIKVAKKNRKIKLIEAAEEARAAAAGPPPPAPGTAAAVAANQQAAAVAAAAAAARSRDVERGGTS